MDMGFVSETMNIGIRMMVVALSYEGTEMIELHILKGEDIVC